MVLHTYKCITESFLYAPIRVDYFKSVSIGHATLYLMNILIEVLIYHFVGWLFNAGKLGEVSITDYNDDSGQLLYYIRMYVCISVYLCILV